MDRSERLALLLDPAKEKSLEEVIEAKLDSKARKAAVVVSNGGGTDSIPARLVDVVSVDGTADSEEGNMKVVVSTRGTSDSEVAKAVDVVSVDG